MRIGRGGSFIVGQLEYDLEEFRPIGDQSRQENGASSIGTTWVIMRCGSPRHPCAEASSVSGASRRRSQGGEPARHAVDLGAAHGEAIVVEFLAEPGPSAPPW